MKPLKFPELIRCDRINLKLLKPSDATQIFNLVNNQRKYIGEYLDWVDNIQTIDDEIQYVNQKIKERGNLISFDWCIYKNSTDKFIGYIGTDPVGTLLNIGQCIDWKNDTISFAYFLDKNANGNGYMTEALDTLKEIAIGMGFKRIEIHAEPNNTKSQAVAKRCGFAHDEKDSGNMHYISKK